MKWYAISGSWKTINKKILKAVESIVSKIIKRGDGIVTGGALGVDYIATQTVLKSGKLNQIKIYLPIKLESFCTHYVKRAKEGIISKKQAKDITSQLQKIYELNPATIIDNTAFTLANQESYYARNTKIIEASDIVYAFQVNNSPGTQDAITKAKQLGKSIIIKKYRAEL